MEESSVGITVGGGKRAIERDRSASIVLQRAIRRTLAGVTIRDRLKMAEREANDLSKHLLVQHVALSEKTGRRWRRFG